MEKLCGIVEGIIYENEANGYTVCDVSSEGKLYTLTGCMPGLCEGERLEAYGEWKNHPEYGKQFNVRMFERMEPETEDEIEMYLGSGILPYVGKSTARKIVERFGRDALDIIEGDPQRLAEIKGITKAKADEIYKRYVEQIGLKKIVVFFQRYGISPNLAVKAYRTFGDNIEALVRDNPFVLTTIEGFTFKDCDQIAENMKIPKSFLPRIYAGIKSVLLNSAYLNGHTFLPKGTLVGQAKLFLEVDNDLIEDAISVLAAQGEVAVERMDDFDGVYLKLFYDAERCVAERLREMSGLIYPVDRADLDQMIARAEEETEIVLADAQRDAIDGVMRNSVTVITGGPGTGKTTIINTIIKIMEAQGKEIALAAPTGRAAKRMCEVTGIEAKTIHRLLENMPGQGGQVYFARNENNKLECDVLIVDEMSMVDILLMHHLLLALPKSARLIMVGDVDQLPAVGAGNVLRDIIHSDSVECIRLTEIFRQAKESMIVVNAHRINKGNLPFCNDADNDFFMLECDNAEYICHTIADLCKTRIPKAYGVDSISQIQVLTPTRKTQIGVQNLNEVLQRSLNPPKHKNAEKASGGCTFRLGDKVMQNKNNYNLEWTKPNSEKGMGVFNGDVGFVTDINYLSKHLTVTYEDDKAVRYEFAALEELELAYAVTVHKSQGSEFDVVIMPMAETHRLLMTRNLLYTAITRAKKLVILVGSEDVLKRFVDNDNVLPRYSGLRERMIIR